MSIKLIYVCINNFFRYIHNILAEFSEKPINWTKYEAVLGGPDSSAATEVSDFVKVLAHQVSDQILECRWRDVEICDGRNFTTIVTDWGVCFTFNDPANKSEVLKIQQSGTRNGLFLRLNVEQFEYISGEHTSAGFKV